MIPTNPIMLLSFINTKLRDEYNSLEELCNSLDLDIIEINKKLNEINYSYNKELNQFK